MKKNLLALSIAAMVGGIAGGANAQVVIDTTGGGRVISNAQAFGRLAAPAANFAATRLSNSTTGIGHVLFVPYFTTQNGNGTLINLVNHDQVNGKAVKLRFRGASNSDDLFDITIYLSPGDHWAANVSANGELSALSTDDTSCTLPSAAQIKETKGNFSVNRVLNNAAAETREGYIEVLNMADIRPGTGANGANSALFTAVKHVAGKAPCTQAVLDLQANPLVAFDPVNDPVARGYSWPTGGLSLNWSIVNTTTRASWTGEAVALRATPTNVVNEAGAANLVFSPQTGEIVDDNFVAALTADPLLRLPAGANGRVRSANYDFPDLSTPYTAGSNNPEVQAGELAMALETYSISNEFVTNASVNFATDWVFAMPTRRYAVALNYETKLPVFNGGVTRHFTASNVSLNKDKTRLCVDAGQLTAFDREEQSRTTFVISPDDILRFCGEAAVLSFNDKASVLGAKLTTQNVPTKFVDGWMQIKTPGLGNGLPVVGFATAKALDAAGGNYGGTWVHRTNAFRNQPF